MCFPSKPLPKSDYADVPYLAALLTYFGFAILILIGVIRDVLSRLLRPPKQGHRKGYAPLLPLFYDFYMRRLYLRIQDCWARPISSRAGAYIEVLERCEDREGLGDGRPILKVIEEYKKWCLNLGSYNYLGFAEFKDGTSVVESIKNGVCTGGSEHMGGRMKMHVELEKLVAWFLGKDECVIMGMGFATNSQIIPCVISKGDVVVSDELNHASIVVGIRSSGAKVRVFKHNCMEDLEKVVRDIVVEGEAKRVWIVVEGMYSMEGETCKLKEIVRIKKKYGAYVYLDEAHSIGALGKSGRGVAEVYGVDTKDVDVMMGTFTKSFGAVGGYVTANKEVIQRIREFAPGLLYAASMSVPCVLHITQVLRVIAGLDGTNIGERKIKQLRDNAIYFRQHIKKMGLQTLGDWDSPVVPIMIYAPGRIAAFSRMCYERGVAVVVASFPATPLLLGRARVCLSAAHTRQDLDFALKVIGEVATILEMRYNRSWTQSLFGKLWKTKENCMSGLPGHEKCDGGECGIKEY